MIHINTHGKHTHTHTKKALTLRLSIDLISAGFQDAVAGNSACRHAVFVISTCAPHVLGY